MKKLWILAVATLATATVAGTAQAQTPPEGAPPAAPEGTPPVAATPAPANTGGGFGQVGQIAISGELQASLVHASTSMGGGSSTTIKIQPSLDYFLAPNVSVGGALGIAHAAAGTGTGSVTTIGIAARGGYNVGLTPVLSLWAQAQLGYNHLSFSPGGGIADVSGYTVTFGVFVPVLYHVTEHLFVGLGPVFQTELMSKVMSADAPKETDFGLQSVVGGYFGS
jgi:hypothetical protein